MKVLPWVVFGVSILSSCDSREPESEAGDASGETDFPQVSVCSPSAPVPLDWSIQGPSSPATDVEVNDEEASVLCTVVAITGPAASGWSLSLSCAESEGAAVLPYEVTFALSSSPFVAIDPLAELELRYRRWSGFEVGGGTHLMLLQHGEAILAASTETAEGGLVGHCAEATGRFRAQANTWLAAVSASLEPSECEDGSTFRLAAKPGTTPSYVYPGHEGELGSDWHARVETARCSVQAGGEGWHVDLVVWRTSVVPQ